MRSKRQYHSPMFTPARLSSASFSTLFTLGPGPVKSLSTPAPHQLSMDAPIVAMIAVCQPTSTHAPYLAQETTYFTMILGLLCGNGSLCGVQGGKPFDSGTD